MEAMSSRKSRRAASRSAPATPVPAHHQHEADGGQEAIDGLRMRIAEKAATNLLIAQATQPKPQSASAAGGRTARASGRQRQRRDDDQHRHAGKEPEAETQKVGIEDRANAERTTKTGLKWTLK